MPATSPCSPSLPSWIPRTVRNARDLVSSYRLRWRDPLGRFLDTHLRPGDHALDIGANRGVYTRLMGRLVGCAGKVHAFEPIPAMGAHLMSHPGTEMIRVHQYAVSNSAGDRREFFVDLRDGKNSVASSLNRLDDLDQVRTIDVTTMTVDCFCERHDLQPQLIKIDVEGHELEVFQGAVETITRCRPILIFEFWESWWNRSVKRIFDFLNRHYTLVRLQDRQIVNRHYYTHCGNGSVDIGCLPVEELRHDPLPSDCLFDPAATAGRSTSMRPSVLT